MIVSAGNEEIFPFALPVGVGLIESTINLTRLCLFDKPNQLLFIGSAGSYGKLNPFEIIESSHASQIEHSFFQDNSYTPIDNSISSHEDVSRGTIVNSSNYITTDPIISKAYERFGIIAENMEFFALARVAKEFDIPFKGIFVITNYCDEDAHTSYLTNIKEAKERLIEYLKEKGYIQ